VVKLMSDVERRRVRRQVGIRKTSASESLLRCHNPLQMTSEPGRSFCPRMSLAGARRLARRRPAWRRREPDLLLLHGTWGAPG
jgi:hypothetical protein